MKIQVLAATLVASALFGSIAHAAITHVPPAEATAGTEIELFADAPPASPTLVVHYRAHGKDASRPFQTIELVRKDGSQWVAVVPATSVTAPGLDYYITSGAQPVFASASWPHTMPVTVTRAAERRTRDLARVEGRRSRVNTSFEWVEFGTRKDRNGDDVLDRYFRVDADFSYRLLAYPLEELRVGYTGLCGDQLDCSDKGFKVGGWFELGLGVVEGVRVDGRVMVMATEQGFALGGRVEGRLGVRDASHIAMGVEHLADVGTSGFFRLGWGTVPNTPMAATVEISQIPDENRAAGVRLYYDVARYIGGGFRAGVRVGYAARNQEVAGFTGGLNALVDF
ncbi:MAG: hypothetical protein ACKV2T_27040 [Kofleriaceae bacterium]